MFRAARLPVTIILTTHAEQKKLRGLLARISCLSPVTSFYVGPDIVRALSLEQSYSSESYEVLTTTSVEIQVFWDVTYCRILNIYRRVGRRTASAIKIELR
jgi:hypothetical protein